MKLKHYPKYFNGTYAYSLVQGIVMLSVLLILINCGVAMAQVGNQSDWNVPPPSPPGSTTKGDTEGKTGKGSVAYLTISDVTTVIQQSVSFPVLDLPPIGTTPPEVVQPEQPPAEMIAALPDTPLPEMPETPDMPTRVLQDAPEPPPSPVPVPVAPELPAPPRAPAGLAAQIQPGNGLPLMPDVAPSAQLTAPPVGSVLWNTPGVPESINFKLIIN